MQRRNFLKGLAATSFCGLVEPRFLFAQGAGGGRIKNFVHIFLYGGADGRFMFPYLSGEVDAVIRTVRPNIVPNVNDIAQVTGMNQNGRKNIVGFHPYFKELVDKLNETGAGVSIFTEYGVTAGNVFSHEAAQTHFQMGSTQSPQSLHRGWLPRLVDAAGLPSMAVWGIGETSPMMFNANQEKPMVLSNLSSFQFASRNFGSFRNSVGAEDSAYQRYIAQKLTNQEHPEIPLDKAITQTLDNVYPTVGIIQTVNATTVDAAQFRPGSGNTNSFQTAMSDIAKLIKYANSTDAPQSLQSSTKIMCAQMGGWDAHTNIVSGYSSPMIYLGNAIKGLVHHLKLWGLLDSTVILVHSEFGRTTRSNSSAGLDHGGASIAMAIGGKVKRAVIGPDPSLQEANALNYFTPQLSFTGVLKEILGAGGFSNDILSQVFSDSFPGEGGLNFIS